MIGDYQPPISAFQVNKARKRFPCKGETNLILHADDLTLRERKLLEIGEPLFEVIQIYLTVWRFCADVLFKMPYIKRGKVFFAEQALKIHLKDQMYIASILRKETAPFSEVSAIPVTIQVGQKPFIRAF